MPLRDHFRPPTDDLASWDMLHGGWPMMMMVLRLKQLLSPDYFAAPTVHLGSSVEVDVGTFERGTVDAFTPSSLTATLQRPTLRGAIEVLDVDDYSVQIYDARRRRQLVAAIAIVSPSNKDRPASRQAFIRKCATMLQNGVCVTVVDLVTLPDHSLYADLVADYRLTDDTLTDPPNSIYAVTCRSVQPKKRRYLEAWHFPLTVGAPLPTIPLWLRDDYVLNFALEESYEETCAALSIP